MCKYNRCSCTKLFKQLEELDDDDIYCKKFDELDIDGSGSITLDELRVSLFGEASEGDIQFIMSVSKKQLITQNTL